MFPSDRFTGRIQKLRKSYRTRPVDDQIAIIGQTFVDVNRHLPAELVEELFQHFSARLGPEESDSAEPGPDATPFDRCGKLGDVVDLLHEQYDVDADPLSSEEWSAIGEIVSAHALHMDMDFVTYVMKLAVDHRAL